jgi:hypothetical protein
MASETTSLLASKADDVGHGDGPAMKSTKLVTTIFLVVQIILIPFFVFGTTYSSDDFSTSEYIAFRDIMAMLLLGFGYLMTFLKNYGLGAVGLAMMLSILSMETNILVEYLLRILNAEDGQDASFPLPISMATLIDAEFSAATLMITFGALIGFASPLQMILICFSQAFFYAFNKVFLVLGHIGAEDVGGSMTIVRKCRLMGSMKFHPKRSHAQCLYLCSCFGFSLSCSTCLEPTLDWPYLKPLVAPKILKPHQHPTKFRIFWHSLEPPSCGSTGPALWERRKLPLRNMSNTVSSIPSWHSLVLQP